MPNKSGDNPKPRKSKKKAKATTSSAATSSQAASDPPQYAYDPADPYRGVVKTDDDKALYSRGAAILHRTAPWIGSLPAPVIKDRTPDANLIAVGQKRKAEVAGQKGKLARMLLSARGLDEDVPPPQHTNRRAAQPTVGLPLPAAAAPQPAHPPAAAVPAPPPSSPPVPPAPAAAVPVSVVAPAASAASVAPAPVAVASLLPAAPPPAPAPPPTAALVASATAPPPTAALVASATAPPPTAIPSPTASPSPSAAPPTSAAPPASAAPLVSAAPLPSAASLAPAAPPAAQAHSTATLPVSAAASAPPPVCACLEHGLEEGDIPEGEMFQAPEHEEVVEEEVHDVVEVGVKAEDAMVHGGEGAAHAVQGWEEGDIASYEEEGPVVADVSAAIDEDKVEDGAVEEEMDISDDEGDELLVSTFDDLEHGPSFVALSPALTPVPPLPAATPASPSILPRTSAPASVQPAAAAPAVLAPAAVPTAKAATARSRVLVSPGFHGATPVGLLASTYIPALLLDEPRPAESVRVAEVAAGSSFADTGASPLSPPRPVSSSPAAPATPPYAECNHPQPPPPASSTAAPAACAEVPPLQGGQSGVPGAASYNPVPYPHAQYPFAYDAHPSPQYAQPSSVYAEVYPYPYHQAAYAYHYADTPVGYSHTPVALGYAHPPSSYAPPTSTVFHSGMPPFTAANVPYSAAHADRPPFPPAFVNASAPGAVHDRGGQYAANPSHLTAPPPPPSFPHLYGSVQGIFDSMNTASGAIASSVAAGQPLAPRVSSTLNDLQHALSRFQYELAAAYSPQAQVPLFNGHFDPERFGQAHYPLPQHPSSVAAPAHTSNLFGYPVAPPPIPDADQAPASYASRAMPLDEDIRSSKRVRTNTGGDSRPVLAPVDNTMSAPVGVRGSAGTSSSYSGAALDTPQIVTGRNGILSAKGTRQWLGEVAEELAEVNGFGRNAKQGRRVDGMPYTLKMLKEVESLKAQMSSDDLKVSGLRRAIDQLAGANEVRGQIGVKARELSSYWKTGLGAL